MKDFIPLIDLFQFVVIRSPIIHSFISQWIESMNRTLYITDVLFFFEKTRHLVLTYSLPVYDINPLK